MSTITIERAQEIFLGNGPEPTASEERELARIALASLEAEAVAYVDPFAFNNFSVYRAGETDNQRMGREWMWANPGAGLIPVYTAPPAPVSVPDEAYSDDCPDLHPSQPDAWAAGWNACRAAMLQGAEPVTTANKLPDDFDFDRFNDIVWLEAVASNPHMHSPTTSTIAMVALELNKRLEAGNSPVIPDGCALVPVEPTHEMLEAGDEQFGTYDVYRRMIEAAPQPPSQ
ncbi:hypothetical protein ACOY6S_12865 [Enterobacter bugandensis]|uniref:hypothetical protein n=1 Tax=Enterobacter bugandensis TaxID=881260 RepID=UPI003BBEF1A1